MPDAPDVDAADWPDRFRARFGRAPRVLHIGNIANYAWVNAKLMRERGVDCVVLDPDFYHVASAPEWLEADIDGDFGDAFYPDWRAARARGFARPEWFINGPTPFALRELEAREAGRRPARARFRSLSALYRRGLGSGSGRPSRFRALIESEGVLARAAKAAARAVVLWRRGAAPVPEAGDRSEAAAATPSGLARDTVASALSRFDVVLGYALGARFALAAGHPRFASMELGTLRGLPFEATPLGASAAELYRSSPAVFVTNVDCLEPARRLGVPERRVTAMPHPFDLASARAASADPSSRPDPPLLVCPARHHWTRGNASWLKGNDVLIRGVARAAARGARFRLVFVEWGEDVSASRALIAELGLCDRTVWMPLLPRRRLWPLILEACAVLDQFAASALGGVALESMALGRRVVTRLDQRDLAPFFGSLPPIFAAASPEQVAERVLSILADPSDEAGIGRRGAEWMAREHGESRQLALQFRAFERLVDDAGPAR